MIERSAVLSPCGRYRYELVRRWGAGDLLGFVMLNPSTADAEVDDPTIRRCIGFARAGGFGGIRVTNLFAFRSTDPRDLLAQPDPVGPDNDRFLADRSAAMTIAAWGSHPAAARRAWAAYGSPATTRRLWCLGVTADGSPRHPLYVPAVTVPQIWAPA